MNKTNWKSIVIFYFLACLWSWPFFWWRDIYPESWKALQIPNFLKTWSYMWGPGIAASVCFYIFRSTHERKITFKGTHFWFGFIMVTLLPVVLAVANKDPKFLMFGVLGFISILGEELGWRGFLQDALKVESDYLKSIAIGVMWELWHFTNRTTSGELVSILIRVTIWMVVTSILSFIILKLTKTTQSLLIAVAVHMAFDAAFEFEFGWQAVLICLPIWSWIYWIWIKSLKTSQS